MNIVRKVLHTIQSTGDKTFMELSITQINILDMILWRISHITDPELRTNVEENFCLQILSCYENDHVVCTMGRMTRLIAVFEGIPEFGAYQKGLLLSHVKNEIAKIAVKCRDLVLNEESSARSRYENNEHIPEVSKKMEACFRDKVRKTYVEDLGFEKGVLDPVVNEYVESF